MEQSNETSSLSAENCPLCGGPVDHNDPNTWKQVVGWVGGPRKDSMRLREDTGLFAHDACVEKVQHGQAPEQSTIFEEDEGTALSNQIQADYGLFEKPADEHVAAAHAAEPLVDDEDEDVPF